MTTTHACRKCEEEFPATEEFFYRAGNYLNYICKPCMIAHASRYRAKRDGRPGLRTIECRICDATFTSPKRTTMFCSRSCKYEAKHRVEKLERLAAKPVARSCVNCGLDFPNTVRVDAKFCSANCNSSAHAVVRKMAKRANSAKPRGITKASIGNRDGWLCGLCGGTVDKTRKHPDPLCPSIDHIVPLSLGGTNEAANLQISHLVCNLRKRNRT